MFGLYTVKLLIQAPGFYWNKCPRRTSETRLLLKHRISLFSFTYLFCDALTYISAYSQASNFNLIVYDFVLH